MPIILIHVFKKNWCESANTEYLVPIYIYPTIGQIVDLGQPVGNKVYSKYLSGGRCGYGP